MKRFVLWLYTAVILLGVASSYGVASQFLPSPAATVGAFAFGALLLRRWVLIVTKNTRLVSQLEGLLALILLSSAVYFIVAGYIWLGVILALAGAHCGVIAFVFGYIRRAGGISRSDQIDV